MDSLPLRIDGGIARLLGGRASELAVLPPQSDVPARLRWELSRPATASVSLVLRVHSRAGIPLASARVRVSAGDRCCESEQLTFLGLEGYAHLAPHDLRQVEDRMWSRRAFASAVREDAESSLLGRA